jgi:hypothetical protein
VASVRILEQSKQLQEIFMLKAPWTLVVALSMPVMAFASSHREAPNISRYPTLDGTDLYMFNSYETGRTGYVTLLANYIPLQDPYGGPNYFALDPAGLYEIRIDNNGDAVEDITFQFQFSQTLGNNNAGVALNIGPAGNTQSVAVPLKNVGPVSAGNTSNLVYPDDGAGTCPHRHRDAHYQRREREYHVHASDGLHWAEELWRARGIRGLRGAVYL